MKNVRLLLAFAAVLTLLSSCKKADTSDLTLLTSHKWHMTGYTRAYSDSSVTRNLLQTNATCVPTGYTEFHNYTPNNPLRLAYSYSTSTCPGYNMPDIGITSWDIDNDNANLYLNGSASTGTGGKWYTLTSISGSTIVLTYVYQRAIGNSGPPNYTTIYDTVTETTTFTAQ